MINMNKCTEELARFSSFYYVYLLEILAMKSL